MKKLNASNLTRILAIPAIALSLITSAGAQTLYKYVDADKPVFDRLQSPDFSANTTIKTFKQKDWLEAVVKVKIKKNQALDARAKDGFFKQLTVQWFVAAKDPRDKGGKKLVLLEKEVEHVNVPYNEDFLISIYLSPNSVKRLNGGSDRASSATVEAVGGIISIDGVQAQVFSTEATKLWWEKGSLKRYNDVQLLNKNETPFENFWYDAYLEIKVEDR